MGRGRPAKVSDDRFLIELLVRPDRAVFTSEIAKDLPVEAQTVRERMRGLEEDGLVEVQELDGGNLYRLTDSGIEHISTLLRSEID